jgi:hypothetical protein
MFSHLQLKSHNKFWAGSVHTSFELLLPYWCFILQTIKSFFKRNSNSHVNQLYELLVAEEQQVATKSNAGNISQPRDWMILTVGSLRGAAVTSSIGLIFFLYLVHSRKPHSGEMCGSIMTLLQGLLNVCDSEYHPLYPRNSLVSPHQAPWNYTNSFTCSALHSS